LSSEQWPLVSVVVPVYNGERYIEDCLRSVLEQDYPALEVIVVDDGSSDGTEARVSAIGDARVAFHRQANSGSAVARNRGVELARGEYIAFNDSDDLWAPHRLKQQVAFLRAQTDVHAVCGRFMAVPDGFTREEAAHQAYQAEAEVDESKSGFTYLRLLESSIYHIDTLLVRAGLMKQIRFNPDYRRGQDFDFFLQLAHATPITQLHNLYAFYRQNPTSITRKPYLRNFRAEILGAAMKRFGPRDQLGRELPAGKLDAMLAISWFGHGFELYRARWFSAAARSFRLSVRHKPAQLGGWRYLLMCLLRLPQDQTPPAPAAAAARR
jgi:glycosyltransferase involved in cell wall biosynthesis